MLDAVEVVFHVVVHAPYVLVVVKMMLCMLEVMVVDSRVCPWYISCHSTNSSIYNYPLMVLSFCV